MGVNPEEFYNQQKRVKQDQGRTSSSGKHGTLETWQIEQDSADRGEFVPDPMDKAAMGGKKPGFFARIKKMFGRKK
ncbi:MAG: hypothetical protein U0670_16840 [Anaerolineae bacterium]